MCPVDRGEFEGLVKSSHYKTRTKRDRVMGRGGEGGRLDNGDLLLLLLLLVCLHICLFCLLLCVRVVGRDCL